MQQLPWQPETDPSPTGTRWGNSLAGLLGRQISLKPTAPQPTTLKSIGPMTNMAAGIPMPPAASLPPPPAPRPVSTLAALRPPTRTAGPSMPSPDYIAENPLYGVQTDQYRQLGDLRASGYQPIAQDSMTLRQIAHAPGFGPQNPNRLPGPGQIAGTTDYQIPGVGNATFKGAAKGGGSLSVVSGIDPAQRQATDFNVRNLESQIQAMRSLRESAQQGAGVGRPSIDLQDLQRQADPFYQPGQNFGDEALDRDRYMRQFSDTRSGRAMRQQAEMGLKQLGNQRLSNLLDDALGQQQSRQAGQTALAQVRQKAMADQQDYGLRLQNLGLDRAKFGLDARKAQDEAERADVRDQYLNNLSAMQAHKATLESVGLEQKGTLLKAYLDAQNPQNRKARLADLFAWYGRQPPESFDELQ